jgi:hypothetical protein
MSRRRQSTEEVDGWLPGIGGRNNGKCLLMATRFHFRNLVGILEFDESNELDLLSYIFCYMNYIPILKKFFNSNYMSGDCKS